MSPAQFASPGHTRGDKGPTVVSPHVACVLAKNAEFEHIAKITDDSPVGGRLYLSFKNGNGGEPGLQITNLIEETEDVLTDFFFFFLFAVMVLQKLKSLDQQATEQHMVESKTNHSIIAMK